MDNVTYKMMTMNDQINPDNSPTNLSYSKYFLSLTDSFFSEPLSDH